MLARLSKATVLPSPLMTGKYEGELPLPVPAEFTLTRMVVRVWRSRAKTSARPLASLETRSTASLSNAT